MKIVRKPLPPVHAMAWIALVSFLLCFTPSAAAQAWTQLAPTGAFPPDTINATAGSPLNNRAVMWGGCCSHPTDTYVLTDADGTGGTPNWMLLPVSGGVPPGRHAHRMVYDSANNRLIIYGGCLGGCTPTTGDTWALSNADGSQAGASSWTLVNNGSGGPVPRIWPAMSYDQGGTRLYR